MHFQKLLPLICVASLVSASSLTSRAADTDVQARARELLREKMADLNSQNSTNASNSAPIQASAPATALAPAHPPVATAPATQTPAAPATPNGLTPDQEQKLRDTLRQNLSSQNAQQAATPVPPPKPAPAAATPVATGSASFAVTATGTAPLQYQWYTNATQTPVAQPMKRSGLTPEQLQQALEAERKENALLDAQDQSARQKAETEKIAAKKDKKKQKEVTPVAAPAPVAVSPIPTTVPESIPPALSGPKEQQLNQLLQLYKADKITPYEYHQERAKILAE